MNHHVATNIYIYIYIIGHLSHDTTNDVSASWNSIV